MTAESEGKAYPAIALYADSLVNKAMLDNLVYECAAWPESSEQLVTLIFKWPPSSTTVVESQQPSTSPEVHETVNSPKLLRVLVADDNRTNLLVMKKTMSLVMRQLPNTQLHLVQVSDGNQAVAEVAKQRFDIVFMDLHMPIMDGYQATTEIRKRRVHELAILIDPTSSAKSTLHQLSHTSLLVFRNCVKKT